MHSEHKARPGIPPHLVEFGDSGMKLEPTIKQWKYINTVASEFKGT
jgi:hypothetical protein